MFFIIFLALTHFQSRHSSLFCLSLSDMYATRAVATRPKIWLPNRYGSIKESDYVPRHTTNRVYAIESEPWVPELHKYVTYDRSITIKPDQRTYDRQDIETPRTIKSSAVFIFMFVDYLASSSSVFICHNLFKIFDIKIFNSASFFLY